jgi:hypothetical protein
LRINTAYGLLGLPFNKPQGYQSVVIMRSKLDLGIA